MTLPSDQPAVSKLRDQVEAFFGCETPLKRAPEFGGRPYEERPQQREMAFQIAACLESGRHLFAEAPTGIGKSFAYLIPAIFLARSAGKPVVISTHTIALQEQLIHKDIPLLQQLVDTPFSATLAKGRENYLCQRRLANSQGGSQDFLPSLELMPEIARIAKWAETTRDGSRAGLEFKPGRQTWASVCSEPGVCPCDQVPDKQCFFQKARRELYASDIIVANHALLCADFAMRRDSQNEQRILPDYAALIIDEAHTFEEVAATHLGLRLSSFSVSLVLNRLYNPRKQRGLLAHAQGKPAQAAAISAQDRTERFFQRLRLWLEEQDENPLTYRDAGHIPNVLAEPWSALADALKALEAQPDLDNDLRRELKAVRLRLLELRDKLDCFLKLNMENCVYWFERYGRELHHISLNVVPIEVNKILRELLFGQEFAVLMTSATMAVNNKLDYFRERLGCDDAETLTLDSPFDFREQVQLYLPYSELPDPRETDDFIEACCGQIKHFIGLTGGKAFVLFTNYSAMNTVADLLRDFFAENKLRLMVQGRDLQRSRMLEIFREEINSVIFGAASFWMGVDVPGEALSNVIITRLPFPVPSHPLVAAICERLEARGLSPFRDYSLPEAVLKFRQGFGRLIRSRDDHGIIVVLDPRIIRKGYGQVFLNSIPDCQRQVF